MIETQAQVVAVEAERTWVVADRRSSCGQCSASGSCGGSLFAELWGNKPVRVEVDNPIHAQLGQQVIVGMPERFMLAGSAQLYLLPLLGLILGALMGQWLGVQVFLGNMGELPAIVGAALGLWYLPRLWQRFKTSNDRTGCRPVILRNRLGGVPVDLPGLNEERS